MWRISIRMFLACNDRVRRVEGRGQQHGCHRRLVKTTADPTLASGMFAAATPLVDAGGFANFYFFHLAAAAFRAISLRRLTPSFLARASPPFLPNWTAAWLLPSGLSAGSSFFTVVTSTDRF
jgi:hypothetical protein